MVSDDNPPILVLENVCKSRGSEGQTAKILKNISLSLEEGRLNVFVGPSGGGKSTLLRLLNRLEEPSSGRILLHGKEIASMAPVVLRRDIAMVMQKTVMFDGTVLENLQKPFVLRKEQVPEADSPLLKQTLEQCGLNISLLSRSAQSLSIGQQQRVSLARTLITGPKVLLLDEPTSALDRPSGDRLAATFLKICRNQGLTVIMATHDLRLAEQVADHLVFIEEGTVVEQGTPASLLKNPQTEQLRTFLTEPDFSEVQSVAGDGEQ